MTQSLFAGHILVLATQIGESGTNRYQKAQDKRESGRAV
jgi:hypothetical protein